MEVHISSKYRLIQGVLYCNDLSLHRGRGLQLPLHLGEGGCETP